MNLFQLVLKQMRQRALGTWLTLLSILLSVALATAVLLALRESGKVFGQTEYGYDVVVGPKGSKLQLVLNTVYHMDVSPGNVPYAVYEALSSPRNPLARIAVPYAVGDTYKGHRIVGTLPKLFGIDEEGNRLPPEKVLEYRPGQRYELAGGRVFHPEKFESVIGSEVAERTGLKIGDKFEAVHGNPEEGETEHVHEYEWEVVGILKPTQTANDAVLFIPLVSFYAIGDHGEGLKAQSMLRGMTPGPMPRTPVLPGGMKGRLPGQAPAEPPAQKPETPAPAPTPPAQPAARPQEKHDDHDHDHDGHDHAKDENAQPASATLAAQSAPESSAAKGEHDHDHDHDHEHADHDHAHDEAKDAKAPATPEAAKEDHGHDHDHGDHDHAKSDGGGELMQENKAADDHDHAGHDHGEAAFHIHEDGIIHLDIPKEQWAVSAVLVKARGGFQAQQLLYMINNGPIAMAVNPAMVMREFFDTFLRGSALLLLGVSALVSVVAAVSILVSIYNAVSARLPEIAIMRALGATRAKVLAMICLEAGLIGLVGGVLGLIVGHLLAGAGAALFRQRMGERIDWVTPGGLELVYLGGVVVLAVLAGLVPALKAYRTPVATNLVG